MVAPFDGNGLLVHGDGFRLVAVEADGNSGATTSIHHIQLKLLTE